MRSHTCLAVVLALLSSITLAAPIDNRNNSPVPVVLEERDSSAINVARDPEALPDAQWGSDWAVLSEREASPENKERGEVARGAGKTTKASGPLITAGVPPSTGEGSLNTLAESPKRAVFDPLAPLVAPFKGAFQGLGLE